MGHVCLPFVAAFANFAKHDLLLAFVCGLSMADVPTTLVHSKIAPASNDRTLTTIQHH